MNYRSRSHEEYLACKTGGSLSRAKLISMFTMLIFSMTALAMAQAPGNNLRGWIGVDLIQLIRAADIVGKISLVILAIFSILSLTVIVYKWLHIRQATAQTNAFVQVCNQGSGNLGDVFNQASNYPDSPLAQILREGYMELEVENWYRDEYERLGIAARVEMAKVGLERVFERTIVNEISHLESKLIFLATTSSVCPFIGLFGTVWGIMGVFASLDVTGAPTLTAMAPGLSTALLTTVGGLFCAIPATIMYNYLTNNIRKLVTRMDAFSLELITIIEKQIAKQ